MADNPYAALIPRTNAVPADAPDTGNAYMRLVPPSAGKFSGVTTRVDSTALGDDFDAIEAETAARMAADPRLVGQDAGIQVRDQYGYTAGDRLGMGMEAAGLGGNQAFQMPGAARSFAAPTEMRPGPTIERAARPGLSRTDMAGLGIMRPDAAPTTLGEDIGDLGVSLRDSARNFTAGAASLPVNWLNAVNQSGNIAADSLAGMFGQDAQDVPMAEQFEFVKYLQQAVQDDARADAEVNASDKMLQQRNDFGQTEGFVGALYALGTNPGMLADQGAQQAMSFIPAGLGRTVGAKLAVGGADAAGQTAAQVENELRTRTINPLDEQEIARRASASAGGAFLAEQLQRFIPGGTSLERSLLRQGEKGGVRTAFGKVLGEAVGETAVEMPQQVIQNLATDKPWSENVGQAGAVGFALGAVPGAAAAGSDYLADRAGSTAITPQPIPQTPLGDPAPRGDRPNAPRPEPEAPPVLDQVLPPQAAPAAPTAEDAEIDALLTRNILGDDVAAALDLPPVVPPAVASEASDAAPAPGGTPATLDPDAAFRRPEPTMAELMAAAMAPQTQLPQAPPATPTTEQSVQVPAEQSAPVPAGADLAELGEAELYPATEGRSPDPNERAPEAPRGKLYRRGSGRSQTSVEAVETVAGKWYVRTRSRAGWGEWTPRDTFEPSKFNGYSEVTGSTAGGGVRIPGVGMVPVGKPDPGAAAGNQYNPLADLVVSAGGISMADARRFGVDPAAMNERRGFNRVFREGGAPLDRLREVMVEEGYFPVEDPGKPPSIDLNDVWDMVGRALGGEPVGPLGDQRMAEIQAEREASANPEPEGDEILAQFYDEAADGSDVIEPGDEAEAASVYELAERAALAGADDFTISRFSGEADAAYAARLWDTVYAQEARNGTDRGSEESGVRGRVREGEAGQAEPVPGFTLGSPEPATEAPREVAPTQGGGLFGAPSARDFTDAATRARDEARNGRTGSGRTDMLAGDGELFAGDRPVQARVDEDDAEGVERDPSNEVEVEDVVLGDITLDNISDGLSLWIGGNVDTDLDDGVDLLRVAKMLDEEVRGAEEEGEKADAFYFKGLAAEARTLYAGKQPTLAGQPLFNEEPGTQAPTLGDTTARSEADARRNGRADAERLGLRAAVDKVLGDSASRVEFHRGYEGLPKHLRDALQARAKKRGGKERIAALYDPKSKRVFVFTDVATTPERAVWNALHELAGHDGLRKLLGPRLGRMMDIALQNPTVKAVAEAIAIERDLDMGKENERTLAAEEALAELAAAVGTGNFAEIESRYKVPVPEGIRSRVSAAIDNFLRRLKALLDDLFGRPVFTNEDVRALLEAARQASKGDGQAQESAAPSAAESIVAAVDASQYAGNIITFDADVDGQTVQVSGDAGVLIGRAQKRIANLNSLTRCLAA